MQIKIEIDVRPEELRRFLGLPDVSGLQEDIVAFLREKLNAAGDFDTAAFVRSNVDLLKRTPGVKTLLSRLRIPDFDVEAEVEEAPPPRPKRKRAARKRKASASTAHDAKPDEPASE